MQVLLPVTRRKIARCNMARCDSEENAQFKAMHCTWGLVLNAFANKPARLIGGSCLLCLLRIVCSLACFVGSLDLLERTRRIARHCPIS